MIKMGFTGTSHRNMTPHQKLMFAQLICRYGPREFHHGDCIHCDAEAHEIVKKIQGVVATIIIHPPTDGNKRAWCEGAYEVRKAFPYLIRNHHIVDETDILVATPLTEGEVMRSGTWAIVRYARKIGKEIVILNP